MLREVATTENARQVHASSLNSIIWKRNKKVSSRIADKLQLYVHKMTFMSLTLLILHLCDSLVKFEIAPESLRI